MERKKSYLESAELSFTGIEHPFTSLALTALCLSGLLPWSLKRIYPRVEPKELKPVLREFVEIEALTQEGKYFYGVPTLFAQMQRMQGEIPELAVLIA